MHIKRVDYLYNSINRLVIEIMKINCLAVCETRWTGSERLQKNDIIIIYSGGREHQRGVALILEKPFSE